MTAPTGTVPSGTRALAPLTVAATLALLMGLQPAATDIYLPALPLLTQALGATMAQAQLTMSALILAFGVGQLVVGPLADRVGRRPVLLATLAGFVAASVAGALASDIGLLIACRAVQGLTLAGAVVCSRAMVRDLYAPHEGAQVMALGLTGLGVVALVGPVLGGWAATLAGWRAALAVVALVGLATLAWVAWRVPETLHTPNPQATRLGPMLANWRRIGGERRFIAWATLVGCTYGGLFTYLAGSSFVYIRVLGLSPAAYGAAMASVSVAYLSGTIACRHAIRRHGLAGAVTRAAGFTAAAALLFALLAVFDERSLGWLLIAQWLYAFGHGFHMPCGQTGVVAPFPAHAGAASALAGFAMAIVAFGVGHWLGLAMDDRVRPFAATVAFWAVATALVAWTLVRRHGEPPTP